MKLTGILPMVAAVAAAMPSLATAANTTFSVLSNNVYFLSETLVITLPLRLSRPTKLNKRYGKGIDTDIVFFLFLHILRV